MPQPIMPKRKTKAANRPRILKRSERPVMINTFAEICQHCTTTVFRNLLNTTVTAYGGTCIRVRQFAIRRRRASISYSVQLRVSVAVTEILDDCGQDCELYCSQSHVLHALYTSHSQPPTDPRFRFMHEYITAATGMPVRFSILNDGSARTIHARFLCPRTRKHDTSAAASAIVP